MAAEGNPEGHSVPVSFECLAPYIEEPPLGALAGRVIVGAPTGPGGAVERLDPHKGVTVGPLVVDPATGDVFAVVAGGVDEFEPSGCFVRRITAPVGVLGVSNHEGGVKRAVSRSTR